MQNNQEITLIGGVKMENKRLTKDRSNKMICGVCSGVAKFFGIDPTVVRLIWAISCLGSVGIFAYIIAAIIIPEE